jgi:hypothetical protein
MPPPPATYKRRAAAARSPSSPFPPLPHPPAPPRPNPTRAVTGRNRHDSPPARPPGRRRPRQDAHGEPLHLPMASPLSLSPSSRGRHGLLPRPPPHLAAGHSPVANSRRRRHYSVARVAPSVSPTSPPPIAARIGGLELHPSSSVSHGAADISMTSA